MKILIDRKLLVGLKISTNKVTSLVENSFSEEIISIIEFDSYSSLWNEKI